MSLALQPIHLEVRLNACLRRGRTVADVSWWMAHESAVLKRLMSEAGLSYSQVDRIAKAACGRCWCQFRGLADYVVTNWAVAGRVVQISTQGQE